MVNVWYSILISDVFLNWELLVAPQHFLNPPHFFSFFYTFPIIPFLPKTPFPPTPPATILAFGGCSDPPASLLSLSLPLPHSPLSLFLPLPHSLFSFSFFLFLSPLFSVYKLSHSFTTEPDPKWVWICFKVDQHISNQEFLKQYMYIYTKRRYGKAK